jgi:hypothetical protein
MLRSATPLAAEQDAGEIPVLLEQPAKLLLNSR